MKVAPEIKLTIEERRQLKEIISKGVSPARLQARARVLIMAAERSGSIRGGDQRKTNSNQFIGQILQISPRTVSRIRQRFVAGGLQAALYEQPRSGRPIEIDGEAEAHLFTLACSAPPEGRDRWTLQLLADRMVELGYVEHISDTLVLERLKKQNLDLGRSRAGASPK
jgi:transposase